MSDRESGPETVRVLAFFEPADADPLTELVESSNWERAWAPGTGLDVVQLEKRTGSDDISKTLGDAHAELTEEGLRPALIAAHPMVSTGERNPRQSHIAKIVAGPDLGAITRLVNPPSDETQTTVKPPKRKEGQPANAGTDSSCCEPATTITAATAAIPDPHELWRYVERDERSDLARDLISMLNMERTQFARRSEWVVSPETVLLDSAPEDKRSQLAMEVLQVRAGLTDADVKRRTAVAELENQRVELAREGVAMAGETLEHMKKWRSIANWGIAFLIVTTIVGCAALGYVLMYLRPHHDVSDAAIPVIIFVLALFAISPAVLLLRERPLKGLDDWSPSPPEKKAAPAATDSAKAGSTKKGKQAAKEASNAAA
jgi:hypothetical protein